MASGIRRLQLWYWVNEQILARERDVLGVLRCGHVYNHFYDSPASHTGCPGPDNRSYKTVTAKNSEVCDNSKAGAYPPVCTTLVGVQTSNLERPLGFGWLGRIPCRD